MNSTQSHHLRVWTCPVSQGLGPRAFLSTYYSSRLLAKKADSALCKCNKVSHAVNPFIQTILYVGMHHKESLVWFKVWSALTGSPPGHPTAAALCCGDPAGLTPPPPPMPQQITDGVGGCWGGPTHSPGSGPALQFSHQGKCSSFALPSSLLAEVIKGRGRSSATPSEPALLCYPDKV